MDVKEMIELKSKGVKFEDILSKLDADVSSLPEDQVDFLRSSFQSIRKALHTMESALASDDLKTIKRVAESLKDTFLMVEDSCDPSGGSDK